MPPTHDDRRALRWSLAALALLAVGLFAATRLVRVEEDHDAAAQPPGVVVGTPGGVAFPAPATVPTAPPTATATATAQATAVVTPAPTAAPAATAPPAIAAPPPTAPSAAVGDPADAVARFYSYVAGGNFDAAYALWNEDMKAAYPRDANLDARFDETAAITFDQLSVAELSGESATVQANFTETYESGASRAFVGYWRLQLVDGRWLLDEPHY